MSLTSEKTPDNNKKSYINTFESAKVFFVLK